MFQAVGGAEQDLQLVDAFKNWAQAQGAERMIVEAFDGNEDALRFYEKQGFSGYSVTLSRVING